MLPANEARGEVPVTIGGVDIVVAAEFEGLAKISGLLDCHTLDELQRRVFMAEPRAMLAVLETCVVQGDAAAARQKLQVPDALKLARAMQKAVLHHLGDTPKGNAPGAGGKGSTGSPGASGSGPRKPSGGRRKGSGARP
jgi:hypothetical protein